MPKINSKKKGSAGELELAHFLTDHGFPSRRGQQYSGSPDSPDVICESLPDFHIECKRTEKLSLYEALEQAVRDKSDIEKPLVCHRRNRKPWIAILPLEDLLALIRNQK